MTKAGKRAESRIRESVLLALSKEPKTAESYERLAVVLQVSERTVRRILKGERDINIAELERYLDSNGPSNKHAIIEIFERSEQEYSKGNTVMSPGQAVVAPPLGFTGIQWMKAHMKLRRRLGFKAVKPDKWRSFRDHVLICACLYNTFKVFAAAYGLPFGVATEGVDPSFLISISMMLMFGYALLEDVLRKRYYLGWTGEQ